MKYTSNDIQIILIHPVVSAEQRGAKVVDHPVYPKSAHTGRFDKRKIVKILPRCAIE